MKQYIVLDIETTGTNPVDDKITEIGAVKIEDGIAVERYEQLVNPCVPISTRITEITGIDDNMVKDAPTIDIVMASFSEFCFGHETVVGHNVMFDYRFLKNNAYRTGLEFNYMALDTLAIARKALKELPSRSLESLCLHYNIQRERQHRAFDDAYATYQLLELLREEYGQDLGELFMPQPVVYKPVKETPATSKQIRYLKYLLNYHSLQVDVAYDELTKRRASKMIDEIIFKYGRKVGS